MKIIFQLRKVIASGIGIGLMACSAYSQQAASPDSGIPLLSPDRDNDGWVLFDDGSTDTSGSMGVVGNIAISSDPDEDRKQILTLKGDFRGGGTFIGAGCNLPSSNINVLSLWVKSRDNSDFHIRVFDTSGQGFDFTYALTTGISWHPVVIYVGLLLDEMSKDQRPYTNQVTTWNHWGGNGKWSGKANYIGLEITPLSDHQIVSVNFSDMVMSNGPPSGPGDSAGATALTSQ